MSVLTTTEVREHLGGLTVSAASDVRLQSFIDRAEAAVTRRCGPLVSTAVTARVTSGGDGLALPQYPVQSLVSVAPVGGSAYVLSDLYVTPGGVVQWAVMGSSLAAGRYDVTWNAGWAATAAAVPADLKLGVLELIRHLWDSQRGGESRSRGGEQEQRGPGFAFPNRVIELLEPYLMTDF